MMSEHISKGEKRTRMRVKKKTETDLRLIQKRK